MKVFYADHFLGCIMNTCKLDKVVNAIQKKLKKVIPVIQERYIWTFNRVRQISIQQSNYAQCVAQVSGQ